MTTQRFRNKIAEGENVFGTLVSSMSPHVPPVLSRVGLDFVFIDTEHISLNRENVSWMCNTFNALGIPSIVRIPEPDPYAATIAADCGASGVLAPYIETVEQVMGLRGAVKLRPLKGKRLQQVMSSESSSSPALKDYLKKFNQNLLLFINIESVPAMENLDNLLSVPDIDGIIVGPHDLSINLELPEQYEHPDYSAALKTIAQKTRERDLIAGIHFVDMGPAQLAVDWVNFGYNMLIQRADLVYLKNGLRDELNYIRKALGSEVSKDASSVVV